MAEKKINGRLFQVGEVLATDAIRLQARLLKLVGGGVDRLPQILAGMGKDAEPAAREASNAALLAALTDIFSKCDPNEVTALVKLIVEMAAVKAPSGTWQQVDLDGDFTQSKGDILPVAAFVLREVLGDFFAGPLASGGLGKVMGRA